MRIFSKRLVGVITLGVVAGLALTAIVHAAATFGPSRPTFTWANPANYITFNSITDNPTWGDERHILKARDVNSPTTAYSTQTQVKDNQEVVLAVYFHNNAASNLNLTANHTRVKFALPAGSATTLVPKAYITADNANPAQVWSTADLTSSQEFSMAYEPGTAKLYTNYVNGVSVSDSVVSDGALIGTNGTDGKVQGCGQFSGYVTIRVRIHVKPPAPEHKFECKALDVVKIDRTRFDFTAQASVHNAHVTAYVFTTKDANGNVVDTTTVSTSALSAVYHFNQSKAGKYTVSVVVKTDKGDATSNHCAKQVTVDALPVVLPEVTKPTTTLPNTGPGAIAGIFAGASALGTISHYAFRRFRG